MKLKITVLLILVNFVFLFSQPNISWIREYDSSSDDESGFSVTETNDNNGYIICGFRNTQTTLQDLFLIRTNSIGDTIWTKQYGSNNGSDYGMQILKTGDGYIIGGMRADLTILNFAAWLLKINENGDPLWSKTILDSARIMSICTTIDGGFAVTGNRSFGIHNKLFISGIDSAGNILWLNYYGNYDDSYGLKIIKTLDNGLAVLGDQVTWFNTDKLWLIKTDINGNLESDFSYDIRCYWGTTEQTFDGDFIFGVVYNEQVLFLKINPAGEIIDSISYSDFSYDMPGIIETPDSNLIFMYNKWDYINNSIIEIEKYDKNFNQIWSSEISGPRNYHDWSYILTSDNGLLITGWSNDNASTNYKDILLVKLDGDIIPVDLLAFEGREENNNVILTWKTSTEINNRGFNVERKIGNKWESIGFVEGFGTTTQSKSYSYTDFQVPPGNKFYRLKQTNLDGTFKYSNEISFKLNTKFDFALAQNFPNPFNPVTKINYSVPDNRNVRLEVYDILGQKIKTLVNEFKISGKYSVDFNAGNLSSGIYIYHLTSGKYSISKKMILLR